MRSSSAHLRFRPPTRTAYRGSLSERAFAELREAVPGFDAGIIPAFLNRLNDYLFILARWLERGEHVPVDYGILDDSES